MLSVQDCCPSVFMDQKKLTILPLGDSITDGGSQLRAYRFHLHALLAAEHHVNARWVGSMRGVYDRQHGANASHGVHVGAADWPVETQRHEGHWGWTTGQILRGHERQPQRGSLPAWLRGLSGEDGDSPPVGVVTLHLGTNDLTKRVLKEGARVSAVARELRGIVRQLCRTLPRALVLLATLIPFCRFPPTSPMLAPRRIVEREYHSYVRALCDRPPSAACTRPRVICVNQSTLRCDELVDGVHPSPRGAEHMARNWLRALRPHIPHMIAF